MRFPEQIWRGVVDRARESRRSIHAQILYDMDRHV